MTTAKNDFWYKAHGALTDEFIKLQRRAYEMERIIELARDALSTISKQSLTMEDRIKCESALLHAKHALLEKIP